jgi:hypothetical protein
MSEHRDLIDLLQLFGLLIRLVRSAYQGGDPDEIEPEPEP